MASRLVRFAYTLTVHPESYAISVFVEEVVSAGYYRDRGGDREDLLALAEQSSLRVLAFPPRTLRSTRTRCAAELLDATETKVMTSFGPALMIDLGLEAGPDARTRRRWLIFGAADIGSSEGGALGERKRRRRKKRRAA